MKIAIATNSDKVSEHFGRSPEFTIVEIEDNRVIKKEIIPNPGHRTGYLPKFFRDKGVNLVISGGAGRRAQDFFEQFNITLIAGVNGNVDDVITEYIQGTLEGGATKCSPHSGRGYGVKKEDGHED